MTNLTSIAVLAVGICVRTICGLIIFCIGEVSQVCVFWKLLEMFESFLEASNPLVARTSNLRKLIFRMHLEHWRFS